ncbi:MAG TPA: alpha/beta hydrolase [Ktedonobacterales bacterium]|jgi:pimeloyl-ACP methyl ester carboxylesterase|nr:alpha/beta hydrolase [Ktedonobacterales bacterium]
MATDSYAEVNGMRLHYVAEGQGPLMLFLHGFPEFWYAWKEQLAEFGRDYLAVAPDLRGYNLSDKPAEVEQYAVPRLVEDVRALAGVLNGGQPFTVVAHDWGGIVAWAFAMAHPESLDRLVIVNAPHPAIFQRELQQNPEQQRASSYMLLFREPRAEALLSENDYARLFRMTFPMSDEERAAYLAAWSQPGAITGGLNYYRAARLGPPTGNETSSAPTPVDPARFVVRVPTLVIWGERDPALLTGNLYGLEQFVPNLTVKRIPDGTHWVVHEHPAEVNTAIRAFIL